MWSGEVGGIPFRGVADDSIERCARVEQLLSLPMRACAGVVVMLAGCGRLEFGYPVLPCSEVSANQSFRWADNDHCYTRHDVSTDAGEAVFTCGAIGGHVVTIGSALENAVVTSELRISTPVRLGIVEAGGVWDWQDEEALTYGNWAANEPQVLACGGLVGTAVLAANGEWASTCHDTPAPFACEIEPWLVNEADGHAYRISWKPDTWFDADKRCQDFGGHLATINSEDENRFVASMTAVPVWLGATSTGAVATWTTGEPFDLEGHWVSGQPDSVTQLCVNATERDLWDDIPCNAPLFGLCERE